MNLPYRRIFLEDAISKNEKGISILQERQILANRSFKLKYLLNISIIGCISSLYLSLNKSYTNRNIYRISFLLSTPLSYIIYEYYNNHNKKCLELFNCEEKDLNDYLWFYKYAMLDNINSYEK